VKSIRTPEDMTDVEIRLVEARLVAVMLQWDHMFQMQRSGLVSAAHARQHILNTAQFYFGSAHARNWWRLQAKGWDGTLMTEVAGPIVENLDDDFIQSYMDASRIRTSPAAPSGGVDP
jgi:hypothetical protein